MEKPVAASLSDETSGADLSSESNAYNHITHGVSYMWKSINVQL